MRLGVYGLPSPVQFFTKLDVGIPPPPLRKALRHVTLFKAHSCLITMALDHFRTFCCPIEPSAGPTLSHAHGSSILLLLLSNRWLPLQQRSHTEWMEPPEECGHKRRNVILLSATPSTRPLRHTRAHTQTHTEAPLQVQACSNAGGKKSYYDFFFWWRDLCTWQCASLRQILDPVFEKLF